MKHTLTNEGNTVAVFGRYAPQYVRTDRNGTKIYLDTNCPRCSGAGESDLWTRTGRTCYECGGTGKRAKPLEVKVYTKEYADKLEARRANKAAANMPSKEELEQRADEARRNVWQSEGFGRDGIGYLYTGNTYPLRDKLRAKRGRWCAYLKGWIAPVDLEPLEGVRVEKVNADDLCNGHGYLDPEKCWSR